MTLTLSLRESGIANAEPSHHELLRVDLKYMCHRDLGLQQIFLIFMWRKDLGLCCQGFKPGFRFLCRVFGWGVLPLPMERTRGMRWVMDYSLKGTHLSCGGDHGDCRPGSGHPRGQALFPAGRCVLLARALRA